MNEDIERDRLGLLSGIINALLIEGLLVAIGFVAFAMWWRFA